MAKADLLIVHAAELATMRGPAAPRRGKEQADLGLIPDGAVAVVDGRVAAVGATDAVTAEYKVTKSNLIDAGGKLVTPGLVDAHTHLIFAGSREDEFERRLLGASYMEIANAGGGILSTVDRVRAASRTELVKLARPRARAMLEHGTTTAEVKSGYGLTLEDEIKCLEAVRELAKAERLDLIPTFMGAHEVPREYASRRHEYIDLVVKEMIPEVSKRRLARFCDVFCEVGVFSIDQSRAILEAGKAAGLQPKIHAEEFKSIGSAELAAEIGAVSADHLMLISDRGIRSLRRTATIAVLLPGTTYFLGGTMYAPARKLIEEGVPVALGTDFNPGSCMTLNMQAILSLACAQLKMTPAEALVAATINAAHACGAAEFVGSLEPGKRADLLVWTAPSARYACYQFGVNQVETVVKAGKVVGE
ncbi:MAG: imidazolonepropionase [Planctomycetes bacterium]|nr:imidazolonepropionase [Planctomycetota bacterium]